jgi:hypothetical protein
LINGLKNNKNTNPYKLPASEMTRNPTSNPTSFLYVVFLLYCLLRKEMRMGEFRWLDFLRRERERESYGCWCFRLLFVQWCAEDDVDGWLARVLWVFVERV